TALDVDVAAEAVDRDRAAALAGACVEVFAGTVIAAGGLAEIAVQVAGKGIGLDARGSVGGQAEPYVAAHAVDFPGGIGGNRGLQLDPAGNCAEVHLAHRATAQQNRARHGLRIEFVRGAREIDVAADGIRPHASGAHAEVYASADAADLYAATVHAVDVHGGTDGMHFERGCMR